MRIDNSWFDSGFSGHPLMAILRGMGRERSVQTAITAWGLGITLVEVPVQTPEDIDVLGVLAGQARAQGRFVGAGTVTSTELVDVARDAGARFVVSPGFDPEVVRYAVEQGLCPLPGVGTASEVQAAAALGLTWVKAFPAAALGSSWIRLMHGPFPEIRFVATGGMTAENASEFLDAGAAAVAVGSALGDPEQLPLLSALRATRA